MHFCFLHFLIVKQCFAAGAKEVTVFDHTCDDWQKCYKNSGIEVTATRSGLAPFALLIV